jgi:glutamyl-Q tRNA(Asp) synthetase
VFRFAPSPNGQLHLGHAYSALFNQKLAHKTDGKLLLRIEDIDLVRCTPALEKQMLEDLRWLGFRWDEEPIRQSDRIDVYDEALEKLDKLGLVYPAFMSRGEIKKFVTLMQQQGTNWPLDPDGAPHYPKTDRFLDEATKARYIKEGRAFSLRLDMSAALKFVSNNLYWQETGLGPNGETGKVAANPAQWGDIVLSGKAAPASYHLASVVDDANSGITDIVRGKDLFWSTSVHRLLQELLGYEAPRYHHHALILDNNGQKLSKSNRDTSLLELRTNGFTLEKIGQMIGLNIG